ncbi:somatomedin-B and thrombospondin type-1 domain-containing protein [Latimeria chalumnae]|uniref:Si:dkey-178e17.3 n=1 Tax=Latimeria chalumnae TaxID=7897 RepID=H3AHQ1_LATCH|nr:PREDICTED: somatomedin-B and thrombospondin type-1 domain-containing protein-like [Latimeria chalumnae]|eukprot:XP_005990222.1 PREDICTED: somatomedin-B and thrombospondin type-1 domain-containing protein-like [Latimeria chalumnae]
MSRASCWRRCCWFFSLGLLSALGFLKGTEAGCSARDNPKCCTGRNNECWELSWRRSLCYCDTYCHKTRDCCEDYHAVCQISAIDCEVGPWGPWSECDLPCVIGSRERTRQVTVPPRNGGKPCPDLKQRRGCFGHSPMCDSAKEVAKILPDSFKRDFKDPWRRPHMLMKEDKASHCVYFRVKQAGSACRLGLWSSQLVWDQLVCVECQGDAMSNNRCNGEGIEGVRTFWTAASAPGCRGSWERESAQGNCRCPYHSLIFV